MRERPEELEELFQRTQELDLEVGRSPENCAVQAILFLIHEELVLYRLRLEAIEKKAG